MKLRFSLSCLLAALLACVALGLSAQAADAPAAAPRKSSKILYTLTTTDRIRLSVVGEGPDMEASQRIDGHGNVNLTYVGEIHIAGLTVDQAQEAVEKAYIDGEYLKHPQVTISVEEYAPRSVSISGAVKNPGRYELPNEATMSVVELVTKAGGFTDIGKGSAVRITRVGGASGEKSVQTVDVQGIITGKSSVKPDDDSLLLQPGDIVYVPEKII
jgi:polysaccharide export outer membrane protein